MALRAACWSLLLACVLALGVGGAAGRSLATSTVQVQVLGGGQITSSGGQILCGGGGTTCFYSTTATSGNVVLTANNLNGWTFDTWQKCPSPSGNQCTDTFAGTDDEVIASYTKTPDPGTKTLKVTVTGDSAGGGNVSGEDIDCDEGDTDCDTTVPLDSTMTMLETPDDGYIFSGWGTDCSGTTRSCVVAMSTDRTVSASFRRPRLTVTVTGNGTVTGGGISCTGSGSGCAADESAGTDVTLTATAPSGGSFTGWSGCTSTSGAVCTVTMTADKSVTATFSGGGGPPPSTFPLSVSVSGSGTVTGSGLNCGSRGSTCSVNLAAGTNVTLTATPDSGQTFQSWGGACSGTSTTCSLTMSAARSVSATFSGGSTATVELSVAVTGRGTVTGGGVTCGNGKATCAVKVQQGANVGLTATPATGAKFVGWGGACSGTTMSCTVEMSEAKSVSAKFTGTAVTAGGTARTLGAPVVRKTSTGYAVTLRFRTSSREHARMRALLAGRIQTALAFVTRVGPATVGPFPVAKSGFYEFDLVLGSRTLRWTACLGRCGEHASSTPFTLTRGRASVADADALWALTLHFRSTQAAGTVVRIFRSGRLVRVVRFPISPGEITPGALLLSPGTYRIALEATDAVGRVRTLTWYALLP